MKSVIHIPENNTENDKLVEFTHRMTNGVGWKETTSWKPKDFLRVVYLGKCGVDKDMFATYSEAGSIDIFKGHLNSGKY